MKKEFQEQNLTSIVNEVKYELLYQNKDGYINKKAHAALFNSIDSAFASALCSPGSEVRIKCRASSEQEEAWKWITRTFLKVNATLILIDLNKTQKYTLELKNGSVVVLIVEN